MNLRQILLGGIVLVGIGGLALRAMSQEAKPAAKAEADPFGAAAPAADEAKPAAKSPFGDKRAKKPASGKPSGKLDWSKLELKTSPAIEAVIESKPTTPAALAQAASTIAMLGRPDLAKQYLARFLEAKPDDAQMAAILEQYSSALFLDMASRTDLLPEARKVADAVFAGAARFKADPKRIAGLIAGLQAPSADTRYRAMIALLDTGTPALEPLLAVLADPGRAAEHSNVRTVLAQFKSEALGPLVAALESADAALVTQAIQVIEEMNARGAVVYLLAPLYAPHSPEPVRAAARAALQRLAGRVPDRAAAAEALIVRAEDAYQHRQPAGTPVDGRAELWHWDAAQRRAVAQTYAAADADRAFAFRLARQAYTILPEDLRVRRLYLAAMLDAASYELGRDQRLPDGPGTALALAAAFPVKELESLLRWTMVDGHPAAATALVQVLARIATAEQLLASSEHPTPLVQASRHGDRRLRLAALETIVRLHPQFAFAGSSFVPEALAFFVSTTAHRRVLIAGTSPEKALQAAGSLMSAGYQLDVAPNGREALRQALACPDYEFALVDVTIGEPTADLLLQYLRRDGRTADLPVGLVARDGFWARTEQLARRTPLTVAVWRAHDAKAIQGQAGQLVALAGRDFTPAPIRQLQAQQALELLVELAHSEARVFDLQRIHPVALAALANPALELRAMALVGALGTPDSQRALVELASRGSEPLKMRQAAALAFGASVDRHGILLTTVEILRQYERYNHSEKLDRATQLVLGNLLDSIEAPSKRLTALKTPGETLSTAPAPLPADAASPLPPASRPPEKK
jgi:CheY-like chemotaxis protein